MKFRVVFVAVVALVALVAVAGFQAAPASSFQAESSSLNQVGSGTDMPKADLWFVEKRKNKNDAWLVDSGPYSQKKAAEVKAKQLEKAKWMVRIVKA